MKGRISPPAYSGRQSAKVWDVWLAEVPFHDSTGSKLRHVLVTGHKGMDVEVAEMTSHTVRYDTDVTLLDLGHAGLDKTTVVKTRNRLTLKAGKLQTRLGGISPYDLVNLNPQLS
ncbi:hypothetical protein [Methanomethylophilus alvi]|uniref:hypothetical protein n=1 Tax=Methanomethylophilus alvi TaxID=1291540 RepID=UPI0037DD8DF2